MAEQTDNIINRVMQFCEHLGMNISSFASSIGVNQVTLNNYKLGKRKPSLELVEKVTDKYPQLSAEWLMRGVGSMMCCGDADVDEVFNGGIKQTNVEGDNHAVINGDAVLMKENEMLKKQLEDKEKLLEEKERMIQLLMKGNS